MAATHNYVTPQEQFWAGEFGADYIGRNEDAKYVAANLSFLSKALKLLYPDINLKAVEINPFATKTYKFNKAK